MADMAAGTGGQRDRQQERAETRSKDSLLHSQECQEQRKYGTFIGELENNYKRISCNVIA